MGYGVKGFDLGTASAAADLSGNQFYAVKMTSTGWNLAGAGEPADGILQDAPDALGKVALVRITGASKSVCGAAVAQGAEVMANAAGKFITATSGNNILGRALEAAGADGDIVAVLISKQGIKA
jgi:hypothetical protein